MMAGKGGEMRFCRGNYILMAAVLCCLVGKPPAFRADQLQVPCSIQEPLAPGRQTEEHYRAGSNVGALITVPCASYRAFYPKNAKCFARS